MVHWRDVTAARHILLALFFLGLVALEIAHGAFRLATIREGYRREALGSIRAGHEDLAGSVQDRIEVAREHAAYLARMPAVGRLLREPAPPSRAALQADIIPYVMSFRGIDRVRVLDALGLERFRCERIGKGVGILSEPLLENVVDPALSGLLGKAPTESVVISELVMDAHRVEVPERDRQVLHFLARIPEAESGSSTPLARGSLVLTVYAAPLLDAVRRFAPLEGAASFLADDRGDYLAARQRALERGGPSAGNLARDYGVAPDALPEQGASRVDGAALFSTSLGARTGWRVVTAVPDSALEASAGHLRGEYIWVVGSVGVITLALIIAGSLLVRMSIREFKLREHARLAAMERELDRKMQVSERMGSLGLLTAGVAHEINNPLEGIENYLALLEREPLSADRRKKYIEMVRYGFHRIRDIVRDLSSFARPAVSDGAADLSQAMTQALRMVGYSKDFKSVAVRVDGLEAPLPVPGDAGRLEQVFINLLLNAARAMNGSGNIEVRARRSGGPDEPSCVEVTIEDDGPGIPPENLEKIFDPFFTTTEGTGLGLSISYGIVRAHGGQISARNRPEGGAAFTVRLPSVAPAASLGSGKGIS